MKFDIYTVILNSEFQQRFVCYGIVKLHSFEFKSSKLRPELVKIFVENTRLRTYILFY